MVCAFSTLSLTFCLRLYLSITLSISFCSSVSQMLGVSWSFLPCCPRFSSVKQAGKHAGDDHIYLSRDVQVTAAPQSLQLSQFLTCQVDSSTYFCTAVIVSCYQTSNQLAICAVIYRIS